MIDSFQNRLITLTTSISDKLVAHVYYTFELSELKVDLSLSRIISGLGRRKKFLDTDPEVRLIQAYLANIDHSKVPYYWATYIELSGQMTHVELNQRIIQLTSGSSNRITNTLDVRYTLTESGEVSLVTDYCFNNQTRTRLSADLILLALKCIQKLHSSTSNGDHLLANVDTHDFRQNRAVLEVQNRSRSSLKAKAESILKSFELSQSEINNLHQTYKNYPDISIGVEFYDTINRFNTNSFRLVNALDEGAYKFTKTIEDRTFDITITGALSSGLNQSKKPEGIIFPGKSDAMVEMALRKLFEIKGPSFRGSLCGLEFSVKEVVDFLVSNFNVRYSWTQVRDAIEIMHLTNCRIEETTPIKKDTFQTHSSTYLPNLLWGEQGERSFVTFHTLIAESISRLSFRGWNTKTIREEKSFSHAAMFAKHLYLKWSNAEVKKPRSFSMNSVLGDIGLLSDKASVNGQILERCMIALSERDSSTSLKSPIIESYSIKPVKDGRKVLDREITLVPTAQFVKDLKEISALRLDAIISVAEELSREVS
jgi:hypothetical protein